MLVRAVELSDFRNLASVLVEPHPRCNVFSGDNGQGKTNLLEAIFLVGSLTSFRASRVEELVRFGAAAAWARARIERRGLERLYEVGVAGMPLRKAARVDGKAVRATADYFGGFNVVLFAADDLQLPRGAPSARRRFLDRAVWNAEPPLLKEAQTYARVLKSRNAVLRDATTAPSVRTDELLDVYDQQLAVAGAAIVVRRRRYVAALAPRVAEAWRRITASPVAARIGYESALVGADADLTAELGAALASARPRDLARGFTSCGPHTDDLDLRLDERPARLYGSQGQLRALVLALKISEIEHLEAVLGEPPILLLDDVSSELDPKKSEQLFAFLDQIASQLFITTTHPKHVLLGGPRRDFTVAAGAVLAVDNR